MDDSLGSSATRPRDTPSASTNVRLACGLLARAARPQGHPGDVTIGPITLLPHQREAVAHVQRAITRLGGALLADPVGSGKTWVALAVARGYGTVTVVSPAALRGMWQRALATARCSAAWCSMESLSRRPPSDLPVTTGTGRRLLVVDEAHHARNPATRRYDALAWLAWGCDVLLLTATPIHNKAADLHALCALFLGNAAATVPPETLARLTCRRLDAMPPQLPTLAPVRWLPVPDDVGTLEALLALPPPLPPSDGGRAPALGTLGLLRLWSSSDAALLAALGRRLTTGAALESRLADGHLLSRAELRRWVVEPGVLQLEMPIDAVPGADAPHDALPRLRAHLAGLRALRNHLQARPADAARMTALRDLLDSAPATRAVLFTHSADTALATYRALARTHRCALLTGHGTRVAGGRATRDDIVGQFAPGASHQRVVSAMRVDVLVTTDLLSEGVDLHDAGLLVHLDLPWTIARLEQRAGRVRRLGATHAHLAHLAFEPPGGASRLLRLMQRLARKARLAQRHMGGDGLAFTRPRASRGGHRVQGVLAPAEAGERLGALARHWDSGVGDVQARAPTLVAGLRRAAGVHRLVAVVDDGTGARLVAGTDAGFTTEPATVAAACDAIGGMPDEWPRAAARVPVAVQRLVLGQLKHWMAREAARHEVRAPGTGEAQRRMLRLLAVARQGASRHTVRSLAGLLDGLRAVVLRSTGAGAERFLAAWMHARRETRPTVSELRDLQATLEARMGPDRAPRARARVQAVLIALPPGRGARTGAG